MPPELPFWFKQRQCKAEPHGDATVKVSGPNLAEAYLHVAGAPDHGWKAALRLSPDGPDVAAAEVPGPTAKGAWETAFELYRSHLIV